MSKHLILADYHYASVKNGSPPWSLSTSLKRTYTFVSSLVLFFSNKGRNSSTCNPASHMALLHSFSSHAFPSTIKFNSQNKTSVTLLSSLCLFHHKTSFRCIYNSCHHFLTFQSCLKFTVIWLLPLLFSSRYSVSFICEILKNLLVSSWSSLCSIYLRL